MMRDYAFNFHIDSIRAEITGTQHIHISHICSSDNRKPKGIIADEKLLQVCSTGKNESESVHVNEIYTKESESGSIHKIINTNKE